MFSSYKPFISSALALMAVVILISGCHRGHGPKNNLAPVLHADIPYVPGSKLPTQTLDLFLPGIAKQEKVPVIVWIHGGAWVGGDKRPAPVPQLVTHGYAVAAINHRLAPEFPFPAQLHDCKAAVRFLRANAGKYNLDPDRIGAWGQSTGGHLVCLLGTTGDDKSLEGDEGNLEQSSKVQAVCDWCGITNLVNVNPGAWTAPGSNFVKFIGGPLSKNRKQAELASPSLHVGKNAPPFLIMHGDHDHSVEVKHSELMRDALKKAGTPVEFVLVKDADHFFFRPDAIDKVVSFFDAQFKAPASSQK